MLFVARDWIQYQWSEFKSPSIKLASLFSEEFGSTADNVWIQYEYVWVEGLYHAREQWIPEYSPPLCMRPPESITNVLVADGCSVYWNKALLHVDTSRLPECAVLVINKVHLALSCCAPHSSWNAFELESCLVISYVWWDGGLQSLKANVWYNVYIPGLTMSTDVCLEPFLPVAIAVCLPVRNMSIVQNLNLLYKLKVRLSCALTLSISIVMRFCGVLEQFWVYLPLISRMYSGDLGTKCFQDIIRIHYFFSCLSGIDFSGLPPTSFSFCASVPLLHFVFCSLSLVYL